MARAEPNQLLAAAAVFDRAGGHFAATALEPFQVKGKAEPVQAYAIAGLAEGRQRCRSGRSCRSSTASANARC